MAAYTEADVEALAAVIHDARERGIHHGNYTLARWILDAQSLIAAERRVRHLEVELAATQQMLDVMTAEPVEGLTAATGGRVHRAVVELAILRGLLLKPLLSMEIGVIFRTLDAIRELLVAELGAATKPVDAEQGGA